MTHAPRRHVAPLVGVLLFLDLVAYTALVPLLPRLQRELGVTELAVGLLMGVLAWGTLGLGLPMGAVTERLGPRRTTLLGAGIAAASLLAFAGSSTFASLLTTRLVQGVASAAVWVAGPAWAAAGTTGVARDRITTRVTAAGMVGTVVGPGLGASLAAPDHALLAFSIVGWTLFAVALAGFLSTRRRAWSEPTRRPRLRDTTVVWRSPLFLVGAAMACITALTNASESVILALGLGERGMTAGQLGLIFSVGGAALATTQAVSPRLFPGWAPGVRAMAALGALGAVMAIPALLPTIPGLTATALGLPLVGGAAYGIALALISRGAEETGSSLAVGLAYWSVLWSLGASLGPVLLGWVLGTAGERAAVVMAAAIPALAAPAMYRIARRGLR